VLGKIREKSQLSLDVSIDHIYTTVYIIYIKVNCIGVSHFCKAEVSHY